MKTFVLVFCCGLMLAGCQAKQDRAAGSPPPSQGDAVPIQAAITAPSDLHDISGFLLTYRARNGQLPSSLVELTDVGIMPEAGYGARADYAYSPHGLGRLNDGRTIVLVDASIDVADHVWCILDGFGGPVRPTGRTMTLSVDLIPMAELQEAAQRGS